jgi:hypothetical protein
MRLMLSVSLMILLSVGVVFWNMAELGSQECALDAAIAGHFLIVPRRAAQRVHMVNVDSAATVHPSGAR